jgi:hypothetical protein
MGRSKMPIAVAEKVYSLIQYVMGADVRDMPPYQRRLLSAQCKRVAAICERVDAEAATTDAGALGALNKGERSQ